MRLVSKDSKLRGPSEDVDTWSEPSTGLPGSPCSHQDMEKHRTSSGHSLDNFCRGSSFSSSCEIVLGSPQMKVRSPQQSRSTSLDDVTSSSASIGVTLAERPAAPRSPVLPSQRRNYSSADAPPSLLLERRHSRQRERLSSFSSGEGDRPDMVTPILRVELDRIPMPRITARSPAKGLNRETAVVIIGQQTSTCSCIDGLRQLALRLWEDLHDDGDDE